MEEKLDEFDESLVINQTKTIQISSYNINNLWPILFIILTICSQNLDSFTFNKLYPQQIILLYGT